MPNIIESTLNEIAQTMRPAADTVTLPELSKHSVLTAIENNKYLDCNGGMRFKVFIEQDIKELKKQLSENNLELDEGFFTDIIRFEKNRIYLKMLLMFTPTENPNIFIFKKSQDSKSMAIFTFSN